jgi:hypothetical protein
LNRRKQQTQPRCDPSGPLALGEEYADGPHC